MVEKIPAGIIYPGIMVQGARRQLRGGTGAVQEAVGGGGGEHDGAAALEGFQKAAQVGYLIGILI